MMNVDGISSINTIYLNFTSSGGFDCKCGLFIEKAHSLLTIVAQWSTLLFRKLWGFALFTTKYFVDIHFFTCLFCSWFEMPKAIA